MTAFEEKRLGRILLSEAFVTGTRATDVFKNFAVLLAMPRYNDPGIIAYYGAHPDFEPFDGVPKDSPYYSPYWNDDGLYFKPDAIIDNLLSPFQTWMKELDEFFMAHFGMPHSDFEDYNWFDEFDNDCSAEDSFEEWRCMNEAGTLGG